MSDWYKMNPVDWNDGTDELSLEQEAAYLRICHAIYITERPIRDNGFVVAGLLRCNDRKARRLVSELVDAEKITVENGFISNRRAVEEVLNRNRIRIERKSAGSRGGVESAKSRAKPLELHETGKAIGSTRVEPDKKREDKKEKIEKIELRSIQKTARGTRLSEAWVLPKEFADWAVSRGLPPQRVSIEADKMRNWSINAGKTGVKVDWFAAWRNWVQKALDDMRGPPARGSPKDDMNQLIDSLVTQMDHADANPTTQAQGYPAAPLRLSAYAGGPSPTVAQLPDGGRGLAGRYR